MYLYLARFLPSTCNCFSLLLKCQMQYIFHYYCNFYTSIYKVYKILMVMTKKEKSKFTKADWNGEMGVGGG
jgi:hypothetical protein